jgi:uncharacterized membrane protein YfcA
MSPDNLQGKVRPIPSPANDVAPRPLKLAAFVGILFGVGLIAFASGGILGWPLFPGVFLDLAVPTGAILGVTLMILPFTGFLSRWFFPFDERWED